MKRLLAVPLIVLGMTSATRAQDQSSGALAANANVAVDFARTSAASARTPRSSERSSEKSSGWTLASTNPPEASLAALSFLTPAVSIAPSTAFAPPAAPASSAAPSPASPAPYNYLERDYRWEIALGFAVVRFRSSVYSATAPGLNAAAAYYLNNWLAIEGSVTTGFAPTIFQNEHVKYLGYGAGPKFSLGRRRLEPWVHALVGGIHSVPQTALSGKNGFEVVAGGGADYGLNPRVSARLEADYLSSHIFGQWENSFQGIIGIVVHF